MVEFEVPRFVRRWRTLGLFCEDASESIHALMNRMEMRFACIRDRVKRDKLMFAALGVEGERQPHRRYHGRSETWQVCEKAQEDRRDRRGGRDRRLKFTS
ncbi:hypothetical protein M885DRAFT_535022, partial [Pelagophyceae sp. CCMP2097]